MEKNPTFCNFAWHTWNDFAVNVKTRIALWVSWRSWARQCFCRHNSGQTVWRILIKNYQPDRTKAGCGPNPYLVKSKICHNFLLLFMFQYGSNLHRRTPEKLVLQILSRFTSHRLPNTYLLGCIRKNPDFWNYQTSVFWWNNTSKRSFLQIQ